MNTQKTHERFWEAMRARFGLRWLTEFGNKPTAPWVALLNQVTPEQLHAAIDLMAELKFAYPPTLPQFQALLKKAAEKKPTENVDCARGYWRSVIVNAVARAMIQRKYISCWDDFEQLMIQHHATLGAQIRSLLDDVYSREKNTGQRTPEMEVFAEDAARRIGSTWMPKAEFFGTT